MKRIFAIRINMASFFFVYLFLNLHVCQVYPIYTFSNGLVFQQTVFHNMKPGKTNTLIRKHVSMDLPMPTKFPNIGCDAIQAQVIARVLTVRVGDRGYKYLFSIFFSSNYLLNLNCLSHLGY